MKIKSKKLDLVVNLIVKEIKNDLNGYYKDWEIESYKEYLNATGRESKDLKEDVRYILINYSNKNNIDLFLNDLNELELENGEYITYREIINLVRKQVFNKKGR